MDAFLSVGRWLRLKQYQIEVTFGVYIFTPIEKFFFCESGLACYYCHLLLPAEIATLR